MQAGGAAAGAKLVQPDRADRVLGERGRPRTRRGSCRTSSGPPALRPPPRRVMQVAPGRRQDQHAVPVDELGVDADRVTEARLAAVGRDYHDIEKTVSD